LEERIRKKLESLGVDFESKLGQAFIKLDDLMEEKEKAEKDKKRNQKKIQQLEEDIELLETMIMYMFNRSGREK